MSTGGVLFVCAYSSRSKAYLQAACRAGFAPANVLLFGDPAKDKPARLSPFDAGSEHAALFFPDLDVSIMETCRQFGLDPRIVGAEDINDPSLQDVVGSIAPSLIVYSGYGGQIIGPRLLSEGVPILHLHVGWLPDYRGSTTVYYSWLQDGECGVSAILMNRMIDEGGIVARRKYPLPPPGCNVDQIYDNALRADLLVSVLSRLTDGETLTASEQEPDDGEVYYVIHPVLKHIALMSREPKH